MDVVEGKVFFKGKLQRACIGIEDGRIIAVKKMLEGDEHHDFGDRLILPGAVDPHVHFREPGMTHKEDFSTGSLSALYGGVTCVLDMPNNVPSVTDAEALREKRERIAGRSWVDYGLFAGIAPDTKVETMSSCHAFKIFLGSSTQSVLIKGDKDLSKVLKAAASVGKVVSVHAEEDGMLAHMDERDLRDHEECRPRQAEIRAIERLMKHQGQVQMNVCHVSCPESLALLKGSKMTFEMTPHHMLLDSSMDLGAWGKVNPPLRRRADREALFAAFCRGEVPMLATDHAPHAPDEKERGFGEAPSGLPGVETGFSMMLALVKRGVLSLETLIMAAAYTPAQTFGLNKGDIAQGRDADLLVIDPRELRPIRGRDMHSKCGWTPFEGKEALFPQAVFIRGKLIMSDGSIIADHAGKEVPNA
ncbi:MAG: dihydroorotase [Methanomassiliicoccales archaeon]|nr:dihydroorotase [Methanomassiliicoccales archaeon]